MKIGVAVIDLRRTVDRILSQTGHQILLQRRSLQDTDNPHPKKIWSNTLEKHTVRHRYGRNAGLEQVQQVEIEGQIHNVDMIYYFRWNSSPREGDRIYEMDERFENKLATLLIDYALPMRGKGGRIEYFVAGASREDPS